MDTAYEEAFAAILKQFGAPMALLLAALGVAIWWLSKQLKKTQEARDEDRKSCAEELKESRIAQSRTSEALNNLSSTIMLLRETLNRR